MTGCSTTCRHLVSCHRPLLCHRQPGGLPGENRAWGQCVSGRSHSYAPEPVGKQIGKQLRFSHKVQESGPALLPVVRSRRFQDGRSAQIDDKVFAGGQLMCT